MTSPSVAVLKSDERRPGVGVAAAIINSEGKVLVGLRIKSHGSGKTGSWQLPGGHIEIGENTFRCAERESLEETGLEVVAEKVATITNDWFKSENKHYITIFVLCRMKDDAAIPEVREPNKCRMWQWKTWSELRSGSEHPLFLPLRNLLHQEEDLEGVFDLSKLTEIDARRREAGWKPIISE